MPTQEILILFLIFLLPLLFLLIPVISGHLIGKKHDASLDLRESNMAGIQQTDLKSMDDALPTTSPPCLLTSEVTLGIDHFRSFLGSLKRLIGGQVGSYQRVLIRARREAMVRLCEEAHQRGFNAIANLRIEFADISGSATKTNKATMVSILACGTAYHRK